MKKRAAMLFLFFVMSMSAPRSLQANALSDGFLALFKGFASLISRLFGGSGSTSETSAQANGHGTLINPGSGGWYDGNSDYGIQLPLPAAGGPLGNRKSDRAATPAGVVQVFLPADRCKSGMMYFGDQMCPVLGRGVVGISHSSREWAYGKTNNGAACRYVKAQYTEGATPVGNFRLTSRTQKDSKWARWGGGPNFSMTPLKGQGGFPYHRSGFVMHSDRNTGGNMDFRPTAGCIKVDQSCQQAVAAYIRANRGATMQVREVP